MVEIVLYGYDDETQLFDAAVNSWGRGYKNNGTMKLPYQYVEKYVIDMWTFTI